MKLFIISLAVLLGSCSFKGSQHNQTLKGHDQLYSEPSAPGEVTLDKKVHRIVIAATNDIQGNYREQSLSVQDKTAQTISVGGIATMSSYFAVLRKHFGEVLLVDSGDLLPAENQSLDETRTFYKALGYDALTFGLNDINRKLSAGMSSSAEVFKQFAKTAPAPVILSNLFDLKTSRVVEWAGTKPYLLKEVGGVKVGIIGALANDVVALTPVDNRVGLYVENMLQNTLRYSRLLRSLGAEVILVMTHQGLDCSSTLAEELKLPISKVNFDPRKDNVCDLKSPLGQFLERLPRGLVDVVAAGRNHQKVANYVNGVLVMSTEGEGRSFTYAEVFVDKSTKKILSEKTVVHQPVMFCKEFFKQTKDCWPGDSFVDHKERVPATFLGEKIEPNTKWDADFPTLTPVTTMKLEDSLHHFGADIAYVPATSGRSQLALVEVGGSELVDLLEEDFNGKSAHHWKPSPYIQNSESLSLSVNGTSIERKKTYRILASLEGLRENSTLKRKIASLDLKTIHSTDAIRTKAAAPSR